MIICPILPDNILDGKEEEEGEDEAKAKKAAKEEKSQEERIDETVAKCE